MYATRPRYDPRDYSSIISVELGEYAMLHQMRDWRTDIWDDDLVYLFAKPVCCLPEPPIGENVEGADIECPILSVPNDIIYLILDELDWQDSLRFGLASRRFFHLGWNRMTKLITRTYGPWTGWQVICVDNRDLRGGSDMPPNFLTDEEVDFLNNGLTEEEASGVGADLGPLNLFGLADYRCSQISLQKPFPCLDAWKNPLDGSRMHWLSVAQRDFLAKLMHSRATSFHDLFFPESQNWILRDQTSQEFVRGDRMFEALRINPEHRYAGLRTYHHDSGSRWGRIRYPGFSDVIANRICWIKYPWAPQFPGRGTRGPWAGHALEICVESEHIAASDDEWVDITEEVIKDMLYIRELRDTPPEDAW